MADIKLKNKQGQEVTFTNVPKLTADKVGGGTQDFIIPSGKLNITDTDVKDVTNYAQAQIVDANLIPENIKKDVTILGRTGTYEGGGDNDPVHYVTFTAQQANSSVKIEIVGTLSRIALFYSTDNTTWQSYTINTVITLAQVGDHVSFYGVSNARATYSQSNYLHFVMTGKIAGSGDCNALLDTYIDATVPYGCYSMFQNCSSLTQAPSLPTTMLKNSCYKEMFKGCASLTQAPALPATTLADSCYQEMFSRCSSLTQAPALPATTLAYSCYNAMFQICTSLTQAPELPATTLADFCYASMFYNCTSLTQAPELPATTLANYCYSQMFQDCSSLTQAPELPATALASYCYQYMFYGCTSLASVETAVSTWNTSNTSNWLGNTASSGTVYCPSDSTIPTGSTSGIPTGWSRVDWTPAA